MREITQQRLKELISYDPESGVFSWRKRRKGVQADRSPGRINRWGYREIGVECRLHRAHRLAFMYMLGRWPNGEVDHINRVRDDNRWDNLREATHDQNSANQGTRTNNTSGFRGVVRDIQRGKWRAQIRIGGKKTNLGRFDTIEEAVAAHDRAAQKAFGEFANPNVADIDREGFSAPS